MSSDQKPYYMQWSGVSKPEPYGWPIVHTAKWCHYRKGKKCTVPFPNGESCSIDNCPMRPDDFLDMFPEDYQRLDSANAALRARVEELEESNQNLHDVSLNHMGMAYAAESRATRAEAELAELRNMFLRNLPDDVDEEAPIIKLCGLLITDIINLEAERDEARSRVEKLAVHVRKIKHVCDVARSTYEEEMAKSNTVTEEREAAEAMRVFDALRRVTQAALAECERLFDV